MTADKKTTTRKWSHLRYSRPGGPAARVDVDGVPSRPRLVLGCNPFKFTCSLLLVLLVTILLTGSILLCLTGFFEKMVRQGLVFSEDGPLFSGWKKPQLKPLVRVFIYNYTNTYEFIEGLDSKLRVQEVGPYSYRETLERLNVRFHDNGTMSYNERRSHVFEPQLSSGSEQDTVIVPNMPLIGAVARVSRDGFFPQFSLNTVLALLPTPHFDQLSVRDFLFGYNNSVYSMAKGMSALTGAGPLPKLGLLATRAGVSKDTYTVWTGRGDVSRLDVVNRFNGRADLSAWEGDDCNRIDGSEGAFFNLDALEQRRPVYLFNAGICRRLALEFKGETTVMDGIPALRYGPPDDFFHNALDNEANVCYRHSSFASHPPSGVFNNSPCSFGSPTFLSFPHFYLGDPVLRQEVEGIDPPDPEKHQLFFTIHPRLGMNLGAVTRIQINIMIQRASFIPYLSSFKDGTILPVAWIETNAIQFPVETKRAVYHATFTLRAVEQGMMYAFPLLTVVFTLILMCIVIPCGTKPSNKPPIQVIRLA